MGHHIQYSDFPPQHPLADSVHRIVEAFIIAERHAHERAGRYTEQDMHLIMRLRDAVWTHYFHFAHLTERMRDDYAMQAGPATEVVKDGRCVDSKLEK